MKKIYKIVTDVQVIKIGLNLLINGTRRRSFDPKTLKAFDKVIVRNEYDEWSCTLFSHINNKPDTCFIYATCESVYKYCIPYNDDTKHLVGTTEEAPDFYRYWEE